MRRPLALPVPSRRGTKKVFVGTNGVTFYLGSTKKVFVGTRTERHFTFDRHDVVERGVLRSD